MATSPVEVFRFPDAGLGEFLVRILRRLGVPPDNAEIVSDSLVAASLRGVDSHGVELLPGYLKLLGQAGLDGSARGRVLSEEGGCLLYDGMDGFGQVVAKHGCDHAVRLAKTFGLGMVVARNSHHYGAAGYWSLRMAKAGCIGLSMSTASAIIPPWQGKTPCIGTNPIAMALPGGAEGKWLLDMATTTVAKGKLDYAAANGMETIPASWAFLDRHGRPTTDRETARAGWPSPLGGYKGSGLGLMAEILCAVLSGGPMALEAPESRKGVRPMRISHFFLAIDPARFLPPGQFEERIARLVAMVKSSEPAPGFDEVLVAGEPEWREEARRRREGVPIPSPLWRRLTALSEPLGIPPPSTLPAAGSKKE